MSDEGYAPKSPDLSSFYSEGPTLPAPHLSQSSKNHFQADYKVGPSSLAYATPYTPPSSVAPTSPYAPLQQPQQQPQQQSQGFQQPQYQLPAPHQPVYAQSQSQSHQPQSAAVPQDQDYHPAGLYSPPPQIHQPPLQYDQKPAISQDFDYGLPQDIYQPVSFGQSYANSQPGHQSYQVPGGYTQSYAPPPLAATSLNSPFDQQQHQQQPPPPPPPPQQQPQPQPKRRTLTMPRKAPPPPPPVIEPSPVKTKFPTARIKRIMQADEEVGKVAQQTPIAVGKALELFMIQLVSKSAEIAKEKGSKRVSASMLKQVVETDEQWDFLRDIVSRVEAEKESSKAAKHKQESSSDEEVAEPKKRTRGPGRKKRAA